MKHFFILNIRTHLKLPVVLLMMSAIVAATMSSNAQVKFGVQAGANLTNLHTVTPASSISYDSKIGFLLGAVEEHAFSDNLSSRSELNFVQKRCKYEGSGSHEGVAYNAKVDVSMYFIEFPLNFSYKFGTGAAGFFLAAGPYVGYGISGKTVFDVTFPSLPTENTSTSRDIKFDGLKNATDNKGHLKWFEFGGNVMAGYKTAGGLFFTVGYTQGLSNLDTQDNTTTKTGGLALKVGHMFGK